MASTNKTSLGLNKWEASDKPVRQDFVNDNIIVDEKIAKLNSDLVAVSNTVTNITSATVGSVSCLKVGKLVQISYGTNTTLTAGNWILLATLPSGYRPQIQSYGDFPWNNTSWYCANRNKRQYQLKRGFSNNRDRTFYNYISCPLIK